jgi:hypothetical protein
MTDTVCTPHIMTHMATTHEQCFTENGDPDPKIEGCAVEFHRLATCCNASQGTPSAELDEKTQKPKWLNECNQ